LAPARKLYRAEHEAAVIVVEGHDVTGHWSFVIGNTNDQ
jgi:hypothetical protein